MHRFFLDQWQYCTREKQKEKARPLLAVEHVPRLPTEIRTRYGLITIIMSDSFDLNLANLLDNGLFGGINHNILYQVRELYVYNSALNIYSS